MNSDKDDKLAYLYKEMEDRLETMNSSIHLPRKSFIAFFSQYIVESDKEFRVKDALCFNVGK